MTRLLNIIFSLTTYFVLVSGGLAASLIPIGNLSTSGSGFGYDVSDNGGVVVGISHLEAFRWTAAGGIKGLGYLPGRSFGSSAAKGVSGDGKVVVGYSPSANSGTTNTEAFRWTSGGGMVGMGDLPGGDFISEANAASADGSVIVGRSSSANGNSEAFRWTSGGGMVGLGNFPGDYFQSNATGVSANGNVVVGLGRRGVYTREAFRWTPASGLVGLGDLPGGEVYSVAEDVSADGNVVVGNSSSAKSGTGREAFRWTAGGGMVGLGDLPGGNFSSRATGVSGDGSVVVGYGDTAAGTEAFVWTQADGMRRLIDVLVANGATGLGGWILTEAQAVSADGQWVVGSGKPPGSFTIEPILAFIAPGAPPRPSVNIVPSNSLLLLQD
jgi:probable HAF family extracellular repeat protein